MVIYYFKNKVNNKGYVGLDSNSTKTSNQIRKSQHLKYANAIINNKSWDVKYQLIDKKIAQYGIDNFEYSILYETKNYKELKEKEIQYIKKYSTFVGNGKGYNITLGGEGTKGFGTKRILCYNLDGEFLKEYTSIIEASLKLKLGYSSIQSSLNDKNKGLIVNKKYIFKYHTNNFSLTIANPYDKRISIFDAKGYLIKICDDQKAFSKEFKLPYHKVLVHLNGRSHSINEKYIVRKYKKGLTKIKVTKLSNKKEVVLLNTNNQVFKHFKSISELSRYLNISNSSVTKSMKSPTSLLKKQYRVFDKLKFNNTKTDSYCKNLKPKLKRDLINDIQRIDNYFIYKNKRYSTITNLSKNINLSFAYLFQELNNKQYVLDNNLNQNKYILYNRETLKEIKQFKTLVLLSDYLNESFKYVSLFINKKTNAIRFHKYLVITNEEFDSNKTNLVTYLTNLKNKYSKIKFRNYNT